MIPKPIAIFFFIIVSELQVPMLIACPAAVNLRVTTIVAHYFRKSLLLTCQHIPPTCIYMFANPMLHAAKARICFPPFGERWSQDGDSPNGGKQVRAKGPDVRRRRRAVAGL